MSSKFGKSLRDIRVKRSLTLEEMADLLGTTKQALSRYERGERTPKITIAAEFADKLGVDLRILVEEGTEEMTLGAFDEPKDNAPKTKESRIISAGIDKMPKKRREQALKILQAAFSEFFEEDTNNDA